MKGMGLKAPAAAVPARKPAAPRHERIAPTKVAAKPAVRRGKDSKVPTPVAKTVKRASPKAVPTPLAESPMPPPAPSVVIGDPIPKPKVKPVVDTRFGYRGITR